MSYTSLLPGDTTLLRAPTTYAGGGGVGEERRRFPRVPISVEVRAKHVDLPVIKAKSFDISAGGIGLLSKQELPKGKMMQLEMEIPVPLVVTLGEVAWTKKLKTEKGKFFQTGIHFSPGSILANYRDMKGFVDSVIEDTKT